MQGEEALRNRERRQLGDGISDRRALPQHNRNPRAKEWNSSKFTVDACPTRLSVTWKIREFSTTPAETGDLVESEKFRFLDSTWVLRFFPRGQRTACAGHLYLCLVRIPDADPGKDAMSKLFYRDHSGKEYLSGEREVNPFRKVDHVDIATLIKLEDLHGELRERLLVDDTLVIRCELRDPDAGEQEDARTDTEDETKSFSSDHRKLLADIAAVYEETPFPDVTIKVGGKQFPAHRAILSSRSSVFRGMFEADMEESRNRFAELREMEEQTFRDMLQYIYTGDVRDLNVESAKSLYVAADQYDLSGLRDKCRRYLQGHISVENVCQITLMADLHSDEKLRSSVKLFLCKNHQRLKLLQF